jgi:membrane-bound lytic murein transglycosylase D
MMVTVRRKPALLLSAAVFALLAAGCSNVPTVVNSEEAAVVTREEMAKAGIKLDEADIGTAGPEQIEAAIAALDEQTRGGRPLVTASGASNAPGDGNMDLMDRMRAGFDIADVDHEWVDTEVRWFANHPEYLDRTFKRGERYLYHIVKELEARRMPLELALLPIVESAFNPVAYSRARASGLWQFIPDTGRRFGLKQNWYYDGRRDVIAGTSAALDYLEFLYLEFEGDWTLAVAAYNCGEAAVARAVERNRDAGLPTDFFHLKLPKETRAYVPKLLAMRRIVADPAAHGLAFAPIPNEPYFVKVAVTGQIDLHVAAEIADLPKEELLALNPAFNHWVTDPDGPYYLLVPSDREAKVLAGLTSLPPEQRVRVVYHRVRPGETLGSIADKYNISVATLRSTNKMRGSMIHPGQEILIAASPRSGDLKLASANDYNQPANVPARSAGAAAGKHKVRSGDTLWSIAKLHGISMEKLADTNGLSRNDTLSVGQVLKIPGVATLAASNPATVANSATTYVVKAGDTLSRIATKFRVSITDLLGWNGLKSDNVLKPGQRLVMYTNGDRRRAGI